MPTPSPPRPRARPVAADPHHGDSERLPCVLRVCSVFEPPDAALVGRGAAFDPIGGMQSHTGQLTRALDRRGVRQTVLTHRPPGAPTQHRLGELATWDDLGAQVLDVYRLALRERAPARRYTSASQGG